MRAQSPKQKTGGPSQAFAHWWKDSRYGDLGKAGGSVAQKQLWKPKVLAARAYELVRRLPYFKGIHKEIAAEDIRALRSLPPFPRLTQLQRNLLLLLFLRRPPIRVVRSGNPPLEHDYTNPLPPVSFDRSAMSKAAILDYLEQWLEAEDRRLGLREATGPKGRKSRNRAQKYRVATWKVIELADPRGPMKPKLAKPHQKIRSRAKGQALKSYQQVLLAYRLGQVGILAPSLSPPLPGWVGKSLSISRLKSALQEAISKRSK